MDLNIQKYKAFVETVKTGSFTKTAKLLNYSQSGISRMINDLEKEWQVTLLNRGKGGVKLTSDGVELFPYAENLLKSFDQMQKKVDEIAGIKAGLIRIGVFPDIAMFWLPQVIADFQQQYPNIDYELVSGDYSEIEQWIFEGRVDCGFVRLPAHPELETQFLEQDKLMVVIPEDHPFASADVFPVAALSDFPLILSENGAKTEIAEVFERCDLKPKIHIITKDANAILPLIEKGLGISVLPELLIKRLAFKVCVKPLDITAYRNIGFAVKDKKTVSLVVKRFIEILSDR